MKYKIVALVIFMTAIYSQTQEHSRLIVNLQNNFGYTIVNVSDAMEIPEYSNITQEGLVDWDQFNYKGLVQVYLPKDNFLIGGEIGFNRLYRWEERYQNFSGYDRWRWGTVWTWHLGALVSLKIKNLYYLTSGVGVYTFMNGTGTTIGFPFAVGHNIKINKMLTLPVEFRTDMIFGNSTPIALGGGIGLKISI